MPMIVGQKLENYDWEAEHKPKGHPVTMKANRTQLVNYETGEVVATTAPGFEWCWRHQHPHVCASGWVPAKKKGEQ